MSVLFKAVFYNPKDNTWLVEKHIRGFKWKKLETIEDGETLLLFYYSGKKDYIQAAYNMIECFNIPKENIWFIPIITDTPTFSLYCEDIDSMKVLFDKAIPL